MAAINFNKYHEVPASLMGLEGKTSCLIAVGRFFQVPDLYMDAVLSLLLRLLLLRQPNALPLLLHVPFSSFIRLGAIPADIFRARKWYA